MPLRRDGQVYRSMVAPLSNWKGLRSAKHLRYHRQVGEVLDAAPSLAERSDEELRALSDSYHQQVLAGKRLEDLLVPAYALVRETARRLLGMTHYPVQILGGIALHHGHFVEMATGEGKTLVATLPSYLNGLTDRGVHIVTVNDYLAKRDAEEMGRIHQFLGLKVGVITSDSQPAARRQAYRAGITYATNKELGFDFLRDELRHQNRIWYDARRSLDDLRLIQVQRPDFHFAIVDEADSILIDEARTPLIIANTPTASPEVAHEFQVANALVDELVEDQHYSFERKEKKIEWLRAGEKLITKRLGGTRNLTGHRVDWHEACLRAVKAHLLFHRDREYVVEEGEVVIVDEFTGRKMPGRQWEEGLHQAVAAKEGLEIKGQTETLARTTYQVFFNRYEKLSGMTGTAWTDSRELAEVYGRPTMVIPTHKPCQRRVLPDRIFRTEEGKFRAVAEAVAKISGNGRPVLVGTRSIDRSEYLSGLLTEIGVEHVVLNARHEAEEASIVADAGQPGRVTVATNMAGRGTDIKLHPEVANSGGLFVVGTERHESRRVDLQLAGRAARQGDPGSVQFFLSFEDPLVRRYRPSRATREGVGERDPSGSSRWDWILFFRRLQRQIERHHRRMRIELLQYERDRAKYHRQIGVE